MAWRLARSLETLRSQVDNAYPKRNKASDGTLGDSAHAGTASDHNPNGAGVVCALDLTHDPGNGFDADKLAEAQRRNPHPDLKYMVWRGRIASRIHGWTWRPSSGHFNHIHLSVGVGTDGRSRPGTYDNTTAWQLGTNVAPSPPHSKGVQVNTFYAYNANITLDANGNGYTDVVHNRGSDPAVTVAQLNGNDPSKEGYPKIGSPVLLTASYAGNYVRVTFVNGKPGAGFGFKILMGW